MRKKDIKTKEEARSFAIDWQAWANNQSLSYGQIAEWQSYFIRIANTFHLKKEFKENGII